MSGRDQLFITLGIIGIIAVALLTSFGRMIFSQSIPSVELPDITTSNSSSGNEANWEGAEHPPTPVTVTVDSVQSVIASLSRANSYYRQLEVTLYWEGGSSTSAISVWLDGDWQATQQTIATGLVRCDLIGPTTQYYWYDGDSQWLSTSVEETAADLSQRIPTYEDVVEADTATITAASYTDFNGLPAIYVEMVSDSRVERYWVGTTSGLLVGAETEVDGQLIYSMTADGIVQTPCPTSAPFALPDGTTVEELE